jgi:hypothetical protein
LKTLLPMWGLTGTIQVKPPNRLASFDKYQIRTGDTILSR